MKWPNQQRNVQLVWKQLQSFFFINVRYLTLTLSRNQTKNQTKIANLIREKNQTKERKMEYTQQFTCINVSCSRKCPYTSNGVFKLTPHPILLKIHVWLIPSFKNCIFIEPSLPWVGYGYILEPHNVLISWGTNFFVRKEAPYHGPGSYFPLIFSTSLNLWPDRTNTKHMSDLRIHETHSMWLSHEYMNCLGNPKYVQFMIFQLNWSVFKCPFIYLVQSVWQLIATQSEN